MVTSRTSFRPLACLGLLTSLLASPAPAAAGSSLRFHGTGSANADRVKIRIDDPANANPGPAADIGASDFTIELWMRGRSPASCVRPRR